jgi:hypothetical protein
LIAIATSITAATAENAMTSTVTAAVAIKTSANTKVATI